MRKTSRRVPVLMVAGPALMLLCLCAGRAQAQSGMGMGMGMGGGGLLFGFSGGNNGYVQQPSNYLNRLSVSRAPTALMVKTFESYGQRHPYANDPNAYINHVRDNGFVDPYSIAQSAPVYFRRGMVAPAQPRRRPRTVVTGARARPVVPLKSFYDEKNALAWPADAPDAPDLKAKREIFDRASQTVLGEMKAGGIASIAAVTDARQKLLDYGRPALKYVRAHETARIADGFHKFLLDLYDSLAEAAVPAVAEKSAGEAPAPSATGAQPAATAPTSPTTVSAAEGAPPAP